MLLTSKEFKVFSKPQEIFIPMLQDENMDIQAPVNNLDYYPYHHGA